MYGNTPATQEIFYMAAVLLVDIPPFDTRVQLLSSSSSQTI